MITRLQKEMDEGMSVVEETPGVKVNLLKVASLVLPCHD